MTADSQIMEALARIEHKVDLVLSSIRHPDARKYPKLADPNCYCPLCDQPVTYQVNVQDGVVVRKCGCSTGKIALDMGAFAPPVLPAKNIKEEEDNGGSDQEDRRDPNRRGRTGKR